MYVRLVCCKATLILIRWGGKKRILKIQFIWDSKSIFYISNFFSPYSRPHKILSFYIQLVSSKFLHITLHRHFINVIRVGVCRLYDLTSKSTEDFTNIMPSKFVSYQITSHPRYLSTLYPIRLLRNYQQSARRLYNKVHYQIASLLTIKWVVWMCQSQIWEDEISYTYLAVKNSNNAALYAALWFMQILSSLWFLFVLVLQVISIYQIRYGYSKLIFNFRGE